MLSFLKRLVNRKLSLLNQVYQLATNNTSTEVDFLEFFYKAVNFYDCFIREKAAKTVLRSGSNQYTYSYSNPDNPEHNASFISWIYENFRDPVSNEHYRISKGKLINLSLQDNGFITKLRTDLFHSEDGSRVIESFFYFSFPEGSIPLVNSDHEFYTRIIFKEILSKSNGEVIEQKIGVRHYNSSMDDIIAFVAVIKKDIGSALFLKKCEEVQEDIHSECELSPLGSYETVHYDPSRTEVTGSSIPDELPQTLEDVGSDHALYILGDFYNGQTESEYFELSFTP